MAEPYLTATQAQARLGKYGESGEVTAGDLAIASDAVDSMGPFKGARLDKDQTRAFPRDEIRSGDTEGVVPDSVLDAVALLALSEADDETGVTIKSESVLDKSVTYAAPVRSRSSRRVNALLSPYRRRVGRLS